MSAIQFIKSNYPHVAFIVEKNLNRNVVVYEGVLFDGELRADDPLDIYWLDLDPEYQKRARQEGRVSDRVELNFMEKQMAFGVTCREGPKIDQYYLFLAACPSRPILLYLDKEFDEVVAELMINKKRCSLNRIYVYINPNNPITPEWIELHGVDLVHSKPQVEKIIANS